jgi:hypothetical protein
MNPETLLAMKEATEKASPGPWVNPYDRNEVYQTLPDGEPHFESGWGYHYTEVRKICRTKEFRDGDFLVACNPTNVSALIAEVERQAGEIERLREDLRILTKGRFIQS